MKYNSAFKKIIVFILSLPVSFFILEIGIRIVFPQPVDEFNYEDIYTKRFSNALKTNVKALRPSIVRKKNNYIVKINDDGQRDHYYSKEKSKNTLRIAIVGSSVNFGFNLDLKNTFGKLLEKSLRNHHSKINYEVILFGRPGFGAKEAYASIKDIVIDYDPDLIFYSFVQNNYESISPENYFYKNLQTFSNDSAQIILKDKQKNNPPTFSLKKIRKVWSQYRNSEYGIYIRSNFHLYFVLTRVISNIIFIFSPNEEIVALDLDFDMPSVKRKVINTQSWINLMNEECKKENIKFGVIMHPYEMQLNEHGFKKWENSNVDFPKDFIERKLQSKMKEFCINENIYFIDATVALIKHINTDDLFLENDYGHYSAKGNVLISEYLKNIIVSIFEG